MKWLTEHELLSFFESDPIESIPADGFWCYELKDKTGISLRFSFNMHEGSMQTVIVLGAEEVSTVSHEGLFSLKIEKNAGSESLKAEFDGNDYQTALELHIKPQIHVHWSSLKK